MKAKVFFILVLLVCGLNSFAQEKTFFAPDPATARWSYMETDANGKPVSKTPAGTFDCFVIEETITSKAMMQKDVEKNISWYAYGIGLVKEETYDKKGRLVSTTLLNSINWQLK